MTTNPWLKFYPTDWRGDAALRSVSFAARGLWMDMLTLMHEAESYGHLLVNGRAPPTDRLARMLGGTLKEVTQLLEELEEQGVFSRTEDGTIYSRRMVRDYAKAARDKANGSAGGNPNIKRKGNGGVNPPPNPDDNGVDKAHIPEARIQKLESEKEGRTPYTPPLAVPVAQQKRPPAAAGCVSDPPGFAEFWDRYPRKVGRRAAEAAFIAAIKRGTHPDDILDGLDRSQFNPEPRFQPHATTWLNGDRWLDEPARTLREEWNLPSFLLDDDEPQTRPPSVLLS